MSSSIPDIQIVPVRPQADVVPAATVTILKPTTTTDLRCERIKEILMARSLSPRSQRAYEQDLKRFLDWTDSSWQEVTPQQVAQFKKYLMRNDPESGKRVLSDATCWRTLTTFKNFYGWMFRCRYISHDPSIEIDKPKLKEPTAQNLRDDELELVYQAVLTSSLPERKIALVSVLLHGRRASTGLDLHAHQFRHTFATNLVLKGMNPYHVMTLTRHKSVQSFRRYTKAADQAAAEAAFYEVNGG